MTCRQSSIDKIADEDMKHDLNGCITKETFVLEQMQMGSTKPDAETKWDEIIADDTVTKEWHAGTRQHLLHKFRGTRAMTGTRGSKEQQWSRDRDIEDGQDFNEAEDARKAAAASNATWLRKAMVSRCSNSHTEEMELETMDEHDTRVGHAALLPLPDDTSTSKKIREDAMAEAAERVRLADLGEFHDHRAAEHARMQLQSSANKVGRPKKTQTKLIADCIRLVRDRQNQVRNQLDTLMAQKSEAEEDARRNFQQLPEDLVKLSATMGTDVESQAKKVQEVHDSLGKIDITALIVNEQLDEAALKERLVSLVLPVSKQRRALHC